MNKVALPYPFKMMPKEKYMLKVSLLMFALMKNKLLTTYLKVRLIGL